MKFKPLCSIHIIFFIEKAQIIKTGVSKNKNKNTTFILYLYLYRHTASINGVIMLNHSIIVYVCCLYIQKKKKKSDC